MQFCGGAITLPANRLVVRSQVTLRERDSVVDSTNLIAFLHQI